MPKARCIQNVLFDGGQIEYVAGVEYDVPAERLKSYPDYFKQSAKAANKMAATGENK